MSKDILSRFPMPPELQEAPVVYRGFRFDVCRVQVPLAGGGTAERQVVAYPGSVAILPFLDDDTLVLIRHRRHAVGEFLWELPAGTLERGEEPIETGRRELTEETGYQAARMEFLTHFYPLPGFCTGMTHVFVARELTYVGQDLDATENIEVHPIPWARALEMLEGGVFKDAKTILSLLDYKNRKRR